MNKQFSNSVVAKKIVDLETFCSVSDLLIKDLRERVNLLENLLSSLIRNTEITDDNLEFQERI